eukprot:3038652-Rhodomonas_salina.1
MEGGRRGRETRASCKKGQTQGRGWEETEGEQQREFQEQKRAPRLTQPEEDDVGQKSWGQPSGITEEEG